MLGTHMVRETFLEEEWDELGLRNMPHLQSKWTCT